MVSKKLKRIFSLSLLLGVFSGCNGIFDCPIDPPSCCYNVFFGCDIFDLPSGCTCSDYGLGLQTNQFLAKSTPLINRSPGFTGKWEGDLSRSSTTCSGALYQVSGKARIRQSGRSVRIDIPGYGKLNGGVSGKRISAKGQYKVGNCSADLKTTLVNNRAGVANTNVNFKYSCSGKQQCESNYKGNLLKLK